MDIHRRTHTYAQTDGQKGEADRQTGRKAYKRVGQKTELQTDKQTKGYPNILGIRMT